MDIVDHLQRGSTGRGVSVVAIFRLPEQIFDSLAPPPRDPGKKLWRVFPYPAQSLTRHRLLDQAGGVACSMKSQNGVACSCRVSSMSVPNPSEVRNPVCPDEAMQT
jgi:hypothetical protein